LRALAGLLEIRRKGRVIRGLARAIRRRFGPFPDSISSSQATFAGIFARNSSGDRMTRGNESLRLAVCISAAYITSLRLPYLPVFASSPDVSSNR
jgi:hypothetical protein